MHNDLTYWLLNSEPWTAYRTRIDIMGQAGIDPEVVAARKKMTSHPAIVALLSEFGSWPGSILTSHKSAGHPIHKLSFAADLGLNVSDESIHTVCSKIFRHISEEGPFQVMMNIPVHFGGSGMDEYAWALCDAPIIVYCLEKFGMGENPEVLRAKEYLLGLCRENGYPCTASKELGKFRGPGRKGDPCPYASMIMLKIMSLYEKDRNSDFARNTVLSLLDLWEKSREHHPYMFFMGNDFRKLKAPLIWYDILHLADTLSHFNFAVKDARFGEIMDIIENKSGMDGKYVPESVWKAWKGWDFGQKKQPSSWLTFLVYRLRKRLRESC
ncbi:MAG: hypothetical protein ABIJ16_08775 [Bacteroidota bacterium]